MHLQSRGFSSMTSILGATLLLMGCQAQDELSAKDAKIEISATAPKAARQDVVLTWNQVGIDALLYETRPGPGWTSRNMAILHAAIFDAANSSRLEYAPYIYEGAAPRGVVPETVVAAAAHAVLSALYPARASFFDEALQPYIFDQGRMTPQIIASVNFGREIAAAALASRADDGADLNPPYSLGDEPGEWRPTLPDLSPAWGPGWGQVHPFALIDPESLVPLAPPALTSSEYAANFNEVKSLGSVNSATRTAEQTEIGIYWSYDRGGTGSPIRLYNQIVQVIARKYRNTMVENARLFALVNIAMADAGIVTWDAKYTYNLWRPIDAIRLADQDGNPLTEADPSWVPLGIPGSPHATPPFPAYSSGHAAFGSSSLQIVARFYDTDQLPFEFVSEELPGVVRGFQNLGQAVEENARSRIYLGVHYDFDCTVGNEVGTAVANRVFASTLTKSNR